MPFIRQDGSYIPLTGAVERDYTGLVNRDLPALGEAGFTIALRFEVSRSHRFRRQTGTHASRSGPGTRLRISRRVDRHGVIRRKAELQNFSCEPTIGVNPQTESVCPSSPRKRLRSSAVSLRFVSTFYWAESHVDLQQKIQGQTIAPEHTRWRVGPEGIQVKDLRLAALEQVSTGSWQPRLFYDPPICTPQPDL